MSQIYESESGLPLQSGLAYVAGPGGPGAQLVRGVILAVYTTDDPSHPLYSHGAQSIFCDALVYTTAGGTSYIIKNVVLLQPVTGIQAGFVRKPRATRGMVDGGPIDLSRPNALDGDNVVIGWLDGRRTCPVILGYLSHPQADAGSSGGPPGSRVTLKLLDGDPWFLKHHGCFAGVDDAGNVVVDASRGNPGALAQGREAPPAGGAAGNVSLMAHSAATARVCLQTPADPAPPTVVLQAVLTAAGLTITGATQAPVLALGGAAASASMTLGSGGAAVALAAAVDAAVQTLLSIVNGGLVCAAPGAPVTLNPASVALAQQLGTSTAASTKLFVPPG